MTEPFATAAAAHRDESGFRMFSVGVDGLLLRLELIARAHRSLDLQYYIFRGDESGSLITEALGHAAERGVRVRILVDDAETTWGDEQLFALAGHDNVSIRVFNPWRYRGHSWVLRGVEFLFSRGRLDYRMHNKLLVVDGEAALAGGRNIGDQYFQTDPESQFADDDVFATGPVVPQLAAMFERYWTAPLAIPVQALQSRRTTGRQAAREVLSRRTVPEKAAHAGLDYRQKLAADEPLGGLLAGALPLSWARTEVVCDSPDKGVKIARGERVASLLFPPVAAAIRDTRTELTLVTPYLVPTPDELRLIEEPRQPPRRVRILTTSLEANNDLLAQSAYTRYRLSLLAAGVELHELRALPQSRRGTGQSAQLSRYGNYSLHAKLLAFDRSAVFVGSMNLDQRSRRLNTEDGLIIHSAALAEQTAQRFAAMTTPQNAYTVALEPQPAGGRPRLTWSTVEDGKPVTLTREPARSSWQRLAAWFLSLLHVDREL
ncbi:MAG: phospholipase D family protein [Gammaproteobacteria bacterium]|nr:phospholipase D family protein [Gammaproteobacteria bacterium]